MKVQAFVNATFEEKDGKITATARLRNSENAKSFRLPDAPMGLEKNDGIEIELGGRLQVGEKYVTPENYKILDVVKGAYVPKGVEMSTEDYMKSLGEEVPYGDEPDTIDPGF